MQYDVLDSCQHLKQVFCSSERFVKERQPYSGLAQVRVARLPALAVSVCPKCSTAWQEGWRAEESVPHGRGAEGYEHPGCASGHTGRSEIIEYHVTFHTLGILLTVPHTNANGRARHHMISGSGIGKEAGCSPV
jgi:hypothetical protein